MSGPGKGRYTTYVPVASARNERLAKLFNARAGGKGDIYGAAYQTDQAKAAEVASAVATAPVVDGVGGLLPSDGKQVGDKQMFPNGVDLSFSNAPNITEVTWKLANTPGGPEGGGPANPYAPDPSSPGPGKTAGKDKDVDPQIDVEAMKGQAYIPGAPGTTTASPDTTSDDIGKSPIGKSIVMGKSSV